MAITEYDLVGYGWEHAKARTKARSRLPWRYHAGRVEPVTLEEVLEQARALYPEMGELNPETARTWAKRDMWPRALKQVGQGQGKGRVGIYPDDSPAELATAAYLQALRYRQAEIAQARQWYLEGIPEGEPVAQALIGGQALERRERDKLQCLRLYARSLILHRCGMGAIWPFGEYRTTRIEGGRVWYVLSLPGVWLDSRHGDDAELLAADATVRGIHGED